MRSSFWEGPSVRRYVLHVPELVSGMIARDGVQELKASRSHSAQNLFLPPPPDRVPESIYWKVNLDDNFAN